MTFIIYTDELVLGRKWSKLCSLFLNTGVFFGNTIKLIFHVTLGLSQCGSKVGESRIVLTL